MYSKVISLVKSALLVAICILSFQPTVFAQSITTIAGTGSAAFSGDGGLASAAAISGPSGIAIDASGNIYFTDANNNRIRKINTSGIISTVAGTGASTYSGDGGLATAAAIQMPKGICIDGSGNIFFADKGNNRVRRIDATSGFISTVAGTGGVGFTGDGGPATAAQLGFPSAVTVDNAGNLFIADENNFRIRKVNTSGVISTIAGTGAGCCVTTDGLLATASVLGGPTGIVVDGGGNIYFSDRGSNRMRLLSASTNRITTLAGSPTFGFSGDGGLATASLLYYPRGVAIDPGGSVYIADEMNFRIRKILSTGVITTIAGSGAGTAGGGSGGFSGDGGPATAARLNNPSALVVAPTGGIYICDYDNNRIRLIAALHDPLFINGPTQTMSTCINASATDIDTLLGVSDIDTAQTLIWNVLVAPAHGTLVGAYSASSTGAIVFPSGLSYRPTAGYSGPDMFQVRVTDGTLSDTTTINVTVFPTPFAGTIVGPDSICVNTNDTLTDTATGGTWYSANPTIGTINPSTGVIRGLAVGYDTIYYVVSNICGIDSARFIVKVRTGAGCPTDITDPKTGNLGDWNVYPNPSQGICSVFINASASQDATIQVTNLLGKKVYEAKAMTNKWNDLKLDVPPGNYYISVHATENHFTPKMITIE